MHFLAVFWEMTVPDMGYAETETAERCFLSFLSRTNFTFLFRKHQDFWLGKLSFLLCTFVSCSYSSFQSFRKIISYLKLL